MARRAVVERRGDVPRGVVVLRAGPPERDRRRITDLVIGIIGIVLLLATIILANTLPEDQEPPPQFEVRWEATTIEDPAIIEQTVAEGASATFEFPYDNDRLYRIEINIEWTDDIVESLPDSFSIQLTAPDGSPAGPSQNFTNPHPAPDGSPLAPSYQPVGVSRVISYDLAPRPTTTVRTEEPGVSAATVQARVFRETATPSEGTWSLTATLDQAGDCPDGSGLDANRAFACFLATAGAPDDSNPFQVTRVAFIEYVPVVTALQ